MAVDLGEKKILAVGEYGQKHDCPVMQREQGVAQRGQGGPSRKPRWNSPQRKATLKMWALRRRCTSTTMGGMFALKVWEKRPFRRQVTLTP